MKLVFAFIIVVAILASIYCYRIGFTQGAASCPIKYAICDNGTCVLSDTPPAK
jgi:hypothetical protein